ncbi:MAG TPA: LytR C-terminal domain-containing protein, partial [Chloroflexota bacterium]|nr:LytR C-terminal domain-containing protein [Chloroflexota bacterium]
HTWAQIRGFMKRMWADPGFGVAVSQAHIVVENDTGVAGTATRATAVLSSLGYNVGPPISGPVRAGSRVVDASGNQAARALLPALKKDLGLVSLDSYDDATDPTLPLVLQLGSDDASDPFVVTADDRAAPASTVGIEKFGVWVPDLGSAPADARVVSTPVTTPVESKHRTPTATSGSLATATPSGAGRTFPTPARPQTSPVPTAARTPTSVTR